MIMKVRCPGQDETWSNVGFSEAEDRASPFRIHCLSSSVCQCHTCRSTLARLCITAGPVKWPLYIRSYTSLQYAGPGLICNCLYQPVPRCRMVCDLFFALEGISESWNSMRAIRLHMHTHIHTHTLPTSALQQEDILSGKGTTHHNGMLEAGRVIRVGAF